MKIKRFILLAFSAAAWRCPGRPAPAGGRQLRLRFRGHDLRRTRQSLRRTGLRPPAQLGAAGDLQHPPLRGMDPELRDRPRELQQHGQGHLADGPRRDRVAGTGQEHHVASDRPVAELADRTGMRPYYCKTISYRGATTASASSARTAPKNTYAGDLPGTEARKFFLAEFDGYIFIATHFATRAMRTASGRRDHNRVYRRQLRRLYQADLPGGGPQHVEASGSGARIVEDHQHLGQYLREHLFAVAHRLCARLHGQFAVVRGAAHRRALVRGDQRDDGLRPPSRTGRPQKVSDYEKQTLE